MRKMILPLGTLLLLAACSRTVPCPICYEDAWSREPFPGEAKQHIPTVDTRTEAQKQAPAEPLETE